MDSRILKFFAVALCLFMAQLCFAHRVNVFAYLEGDKVMVEGNFSGGGPAMDANVTASYPDGSLVFEGQTGKDGKLSFPIPSNPKADTLKIVLNAGEGHRNEWTLNLKDATPVPSATELPVTPAEQAILDPNRPKTPAPSNQLSMQQEMLELPISPAEQKVLEEEKRYTEKDLRAAVLNNQLKLEQEVVGPLRRQLAMSQETVISFKDVLGGVGWLVGIAGLLAWYQSRRKKK